MKTVFKIFALLTLFAAMVSCSDEDEVAVIPSSKSIMPMWPVFGA